VKQARWALLALMLVAAVAAHGEKAEVGVTFGAAVSPDAKGPIGCGEAMPCNIPAGTIGSLAIGPGVSWQASIAYRLANFRVAALYVQLPLAGSPSRTQPGFIGNEFSSFFFTPGVQLKLVPNSFMSPFANIGGGLAHFNNNFGSSGNTGAFQVGGGVDFRTPLRVLGVRAEARDFITGHPAPFAGFTSHLQHVFVGGGVVVKF